VWTPHVRFDSSQPQLTTDVMLTSCWRNNYNFWI
jgi:hypothetical protein